MAKEIERKFLVNPNALGELGKGTRIQQAYVSTTDNTVVRIRRSGNNAFITLKGENNGMTRTEFEYEIPTEDAEQIITELCQGPVIEKTRYCVNYINHLWEIDIFDGENKGLIVAEIELTTEEEQFDTPNWITTEVTNEPKYYNSNLLDHPYSQWQ